MLDIIICYGNRRFYAYYPLLWGTRNIELGRILKHGRATQIDFIDLDWKSSDYNKYYGQILQLSIAKGGPIKYVMIPDLFDHKHLDNWLYWFELLKDLNVFEIAILPVKCELDQDLPDWVRPGLPTLTDYELTRDGSIDISYFRTYEGEIHILGGSNPYSIFKHALEYAPKSQIASFDFNSISKSSYFGNVISKHMGGPKFNNWDYFNGDHYTTNYKLSVKRLTDFHSKLNQIVNRQPYNIINTIWPPTKDEIDYWF